MDVMEYLVKDGDRWDSIAFKAYGDATQVSGIIEANKAVIISAVLVAGTKILIPILEDGDIIIDSESLPPWKR